MRHLVEIAVAIVVLVVGGSVLALRIGGLPAEWEERARAVVAFTHIDRVLSFEDEPETAEVGGGGGRGPGRGGRGGADTITVATVGREPLVDRVQAIGTGRAARSVTVTAPVSGLIADIQFRSSQVVEAGAALVTLVRDAEAIALDRARAQTEAARASNERYEQLAGGRSAVVSEAQLEEARTALAVAEAESAAAQFEYDRRVVRAPFEGRVGLNDLAIGQYLSSGDPVVTLDDAEALEVEFLVAEGKAGLLAEDGEVQVSTPSFPGRVFEGGIVAVDSRVDPETRTVRARAELANGDGSLKPGMTFSVVVFSKGETVPVVPALAVQWSREGAGVWQVAEDGSVARVPVVIVKRDGDAVFVRAELEADALVAVEGAQKLNPNSTVRIIDNSATEGAPLAAVQVPQLAPMTVTQ